MLKLKVPHDSVVIQSITSAILNPSDNRTYLLDGRARKVLVWDAEGRWLREFGRKGQGPGEFEFSDYRQGYVEILNGKLLVLDGVAQKLHSFTLDGEYLSTRKFPNHPGAVRHFLVTRSGFVVTNQYEIYRGPEPALYARVFDKDLNLTFSFDPVPFRAWIPKKRGADGRFDYEHNAFEARTVLTADVSTDEIIFSKGDRNYFDVYNSKGKKLRRVKFALAPKKVSKQTELDYRADQKRMGNASVVNVPEHYPIFDGVDSVGDLGYLVSVSDEEDITSGILIDREGKTLGKFSINLGPGGWMASINNRLFAVFADEEGDLSPRYLKIVLP
ncbi:MAG: 6-bladed beta-propeller [Acidobacteriota bacterium]|nr:6-bladed beta-propeller [Acidobacteriota bacterium]